MKKYIKYLLPPKKWQFPVLIIMGIFTGLLLIVFHIARGTSYLSDDPNTCINCHVMYPQYKSWEQSSHRNIATCNDCHVPQQNPISKYFFKASDGLRHSYVFTLRKEPQTILIKDAGKEAVQSNCERCHNNLFLYSHTFNNTGNGKLSNDKYCWDCHSEVPHGKRNSLSSYPYARLPELSPVIPDWLNKYLF